MGISNSAIILYLKDYYMEQKTTLIQATVSIFGVSVSFLESIELYARIGGAFIGITVGIFTIYRLVLDIKIKRKQIKDNANSK